MGNGGNTRNQRLSLQSQTDTTTSDGGPDANTAEGSWLNAVPSCPEPIGTRSGAKIGRAPGALGNV